MGNYGAFELGVESLCLKTSFRWMKRYHTNRNVHDAFPWQQWWRSLPKAHSACTRPPCCVQTCEDNVWSAFCDRHGGTMIIMNILGVRGMGENFKLAGGPHLCNLDISQLIQCCIRCQDERGISFRFRFDRATTRRHYEQHDGRIAKETHYF